MGEAWGPHPEVRRLPLLSARPPSPSCLNLDVKLSLQYQTEEALYLPTDLSKTAMTSFKIFTQPRVKFISTDQSNQSS